MEEGRQRDPTIFQLCCEPQFDMMWWLFLCVSQEACASLHPLWLISVVCWGEPVSGGNEQTTKLRENWV